MAKIHFVLHGDNGKSKIFTLKDCLNHKLPFQRGNEDIFEIHTQNVGKLRKITIGHDQINNSMDWFLERVRVKHYKLSEQYDFQCGKWMSLRSDDKLTSRKLSTTSTMPFDVNAEDTSTLLTTTTTDETADRVDISVKGLKSSTTENSIQRRNEEETDTIVPVLSVSENDQDQSSTYEYSTNPKSTAILMASNNDDNNNNDSKKDDKNIRIRPATLEEILQDDIFDEKPAGKDYSYLSTNPEYNATDPVKNAEIKETTNSKSDSKEKYTDDESDTGIIEDENDKENDEATVTVTMLGGSTTQLIDSKFVEKEDDNSNTKQSAAAAADITQDINNQTVFYYPNIIAAMDTKDVKIVKEFIDKHPDSISYKNQNGWSPILLSIKTNQFDIVQLLMENGSSFLDETPTGYKAVHIAAMFGNLEMMRRLEKLNCNFNEDTFEFQTPLHLAARRGNLEIVKWLAQNEPELLPKTDNMAKTALDYAIEYQHDEVKEYLIVELASLVGNKKLSTIAESNKSDDNDDSSSSSSGSSSSTSSSSSSSSSVSVSTESLKTKWKREDKEIMEQQNQLEKNMEDRKQQHVSFLDDIRNSALKN